MRAVLPLFCVLLHTPALAGGYYFSDSGIVASGRGGAWVAGADTQFAQYYNPAGIIRVDAPTISAGMSGVAHNVRFDRVDDAGNQLDQVQNEAGPFAVPQLGFATPVGDKLGLAVGFTSPFAPTFQYTTEGAQRYSIIDTTIWQFFLGGSVAWQPVPQFTAGLSIGTKMLRVDERLAISTTGKRDDGTDNPDGDVLVSASTWDRFQPAANLGVLIEPIDPVSIGIAADLPVAFQARGPASLDFTGHGLESAMDQSVWTDEDVALNIALPLVLRMGVAVRPTEGLEVELAGTYETWSTLEDIYVEEIDITVTGPFIGEQDLPENLSLPAGFRDSVSVRLGGEYRLGDTVELRAGGMWDSGALDTTGLTLALVDPWKLQLGAGASVHLLEQRLRLDAMGNYVHFPTLDIQNSSATMVTVPVVEGQQLQAGTVGNGTLASNGWTAGLRVAYVMKKRERVTRKDTTAW